MRTVELVNVRKSYGHTEVIKGVDLKIQAGEFVSLLGPSGCGKTTLLRMLAGLETASGGDIVIGSRSCTDLPPEKRNISMVFQSYALIPHLTVLDNVLFPLQMRKIGDQAERRARAMAALQMIGLDHLAQRRPRQLSGGQQQRVALARAIVPSPDVLLLDEPLSNLDAAMREKMQEELISLHRRTGLTTIFVTHDQEEALSLSDKVVLLNAGRIEQVGAPRELYNAPKTRFSAQFIGATNVFDVDVTKDGANYVANLQHGVKLSLAEASDTGPACVSFRQEDVSLSETGAAGTGLLAGKVGNRIYLGSRIRYVVDTPHGKIRCLSSPADYFEVGANVNLTIAPEKIRVLAR
ncbi:ABC transporter ATP-binding protein [Allorhizobium borbori]|uniref:Putative spermidine/putrescine transport system ATP-binding protein n=1 Tax=Allorhizobium borbori TaxID=485907 RepID=A0A7W6P3J6_9HYPH|nr:ABC transporter ATP-binding protein [Allorhizobium borbori]MBB4105967.1 putative spermidine/putrescine transport system ATP-binding protein [Allorhizobium borbori]